MSDRKHFSWWLWGVGIISLISIAGLGTIILWPKIMPIQVDQATVVDDRRRNGGDVSESETDETFDRTGNLSRNAPGFPSDSWYLIYEQPGQPGLSVKITWSNASRCIIAGDERACTDSLVEVGDRVRVQGSLLGGVVTVLRLEVIERQNQEIQLFYYSPGNDEDATGNIQCSRQGLVAVARTIDGTGAVTDQIERAITLLLQGQLSSTERAQGIQTEFPLEGFFLQTVDLREGVLRLTFTDPNQRSSGGSCRAGVLWFQIEATAEQFPGVRQVKFLPEDLFQP